MRVALLGTSTMAGAAEHRECRPTRGEWCAASTFADYDIVKHGCAIEWPRFTNHGYTYSAGGRFELQAPADPFGDPSPRATVVRSLVSRTGTTWRVQGGVADALASAAVQSNGALSSKGSRPRRRSATAAPESSVARGARSK